MILLGLINDAGIPQIITGIVLLLAVVTALILVMGGKRMAKAIADQPQGTGFLVRCPRCENDFDVELRLEAMGGD